MQLTFIGSFYPENRYQEVVHRSKYIDIAGNTLQWALLNGFEAIGIDVTAITVPATKKLSRLKFSDSIFSHNNKSVDYCIGFFDVIGVKHLLSSIRVTRVINQIKPCPKYLLIYSIQNHLLASAFLYKKRYPETKIILLITDLSEYMNDSSNIIYKILKRIEILINNKLLMSSVDSFILLTENMTKKIPIKDKPFIVMEGIYNQSNKDTKIKKTSNLKTILYSGTLARRYGVMNLITAFQSLNNKNYRLIICGDGDSKEEIIKISASDNRITYMGLIEREKVLDLQQVSSLLVNPRMPEGEYTKYSFPSKILEYFASGTPTLMYKLPGIPLDYFQYCYTIDEIGIKPLADSIEYILNKSDEELKSFGAKAKEFIIKNKNPAVQCNKIIQMINKL